MISIVCATKGHPDRMQKLLQQIYATPVNIPRETIIVVSGKEDIPPFRYQTHRIIQEERPGAVPAFEQGIREARGKWILLLHDDVFVEQKDWLNYLWDFRFHGLLACENANPFSFFNRDWYMKNMYPLPYTQTCLGWELYQKSEGSEEMGVKRLSESFYKHSPTETSDCSEIALKEAAICRERIESYRKNRPPVIAVKTYHAKGSPRPFVIRTMVEQLQTLTHKCIVLIFDDASTCREQCRYLESIHGMDGRFYVKFFTRNMGGNGQTQRFFDLFLACKTPKWIMLDDDLVITQQQWLEPMLKAMDEHPHLFIASKSAHPHPHGFLITGTYELLQKIGGYDLKTFPLRYGDAHADFTNRTIRAGLGAAFDLGIDFIASQPVETAHVENQSNFIRQRAKYDAIVEDQSRVYVPPENCKLGWIDPSFFPAPPIPIAVSEPVACPTSQPASLKTNLNIPKITLVLSTKGRPVEAQKILEQIYATETKVPFETILIVSGHLDIPNFKHPTLRVIQHDIPGAVPAAERGIKEAYGEWIWLLNDDIVIETPNWLDEAWAKRFEGVLACRDGIQDWKDYIIPFPFFNRNWYMKNIYPTPYIRYCQDYEIGTKAILSEEMGITRLPEVMLRHYHDDKGDDKGMIDRAHILFHRRIDEYRKNRPPIIVVCTFREKVTKRPFVLPRMVEQLRRLRQECVVLIYDDASTCPEQLAYLESIYGLDGRFWVNFAAENLGPNGIQQRIFDMLYAHHTPKWIMLDDDLVITQDEWLTPVLEAMDRHPHLYIAAKTTHPHPHGFFMTGTYEMLKKIGGYDLKAFPFRYGDCHADFTHRAIRAGLAAAFDLGIDFKESTRLSTAHAENQKEFIRVRKCYDPIIENPERVYVSPENSNLNWIKNPPVYIDPNRHIRVFCREENNMWRHPLPSSALKHSNIEFFWGRSCPPGCQAEFHHSIAAATTAPALFHLEECRSTWWRYSIPCRVSKMPSEEVIDNLRRDLLMYRKIVTHLPATVPVIRKMFGDEVGARVNLTRLGIEKCEPRLKGDIVRFLFSNSWHNEIANFYRRGGTEVIEAFRRVRAKARCELILPVPGVVVPPIEGMTIIPNRMSDDEMDALYASAHAYLVPSIDLHSHSVLRARANGCIPIACPVPGIEEYIVNGETGYLLNGRTDDWWFDEKTGQWLSTKNPVFRPELCDNLARIMLKLAKKPSSTMKMGEHIRKETQRDYPIGAWRESICSLLLSI